MQLRNTMIVLNNLFSIYLRRKQGKSMPNQSVGIVDRHPQPVSHPQLSENKIQGKCFELQQVAPRIETIKYRPVVQKSYV